MSLLFTYCKKFKYTFPDEALFSNGYWLFQQLFWGGGWGGGLPVTLSLLTFYFFLLGSLYYFIGLYVKIKIGMFGVLLNGDVGCIVGWVGKIDKVVFGDVKQVFFYIPHCQHSQNLSSPFNFHFSRHLPKYLITNYKCSLRLKLNSLQSLYSFVSSSPISFFFYFNLYFFPFC